MAATGRHRGVKRRGRVVARGGPADAYVLEDGTCQLSPEGWGRRAVDLYHKWRADRIVGERNYGGDMARFAAATADKKASFKEVVASRGKSVRAEPISALYEQGKVHHVGSFSDLEDQMLNFTSSDYIGEKSPDRADALVWALTELMLKHEPPATRTMTMATGLLRDQVGTSCCGAGRDPARPSSSSGR